MARIDIRPYKAALREKYKRLRLAMDPKEKAQKDRLIFDRLVSLRAYREADTILTYVSTPIEVDTRRLIAYAAAQGKTVAVPHCVPGTANMTFYRIASLAELEPGTFSVLEPRADAAELVDFSNSICILPGLAFDLSGYRLGYGKGYYDRFLSGYRGGPKVGICYNACMQAELPFGRFDRRADYIVTEKFIKKLSGS